MVTSTSFHRLCYCASSARPTPQAQPKLTFFTRCKSPSKIGTNPFDLHICTKTRHRRSSPVLYKLETNPNRNDQEGALSRSVPSDEQVDSFGVKVALSVLKFYKREISPILPKSCRYLPTCSEYSMIAYRKYGVVKGTVLTAWRLCRCNPLGGSGYDPPRWFDEKAPPPEED